MGSVGCPESPSVHAPEQRATGTGNRPLSRKPHTQERCEDVQVGAPSHPHSSCLEELCSIEQSHPANVSEACRALCWLRGGGA